MSPNSYVEDLTLKSQGVGGGDGGGASLLPTHSLPSSPCVDTERRQPSASQKEGSHQTPLCWYPDRGLPRL